jgi:RNA polymerase sigma-70 factor (ECF subfamily)
MIGGKTALQEKKEALREYVEENQAALYRLAFSYTKNSEAALDVVQEAILKAIDKIGSLREPGYLKTWFYRILVNEGLNYIRSNKKLTIVEDFPAEHAVPDNCENIAESIDMYNAVQALEPKIRTVIILRYFEDMKLEEIARVTSANVNTVKSRLYKGLELLKISIREE